MKSSYGSKKSSYGSVIMLFLKAILFVTTVAVFFIGQTIFYPETLFYFWGNVILILIYSAALYITSRVYNGFNIGHVAIQEILFAWALCILIINIFQYLILSLLDEALLEISDLAIITGVQYLLIIPISIIANKVYYVFHRAQKAVIVYGKRDKLHEYNVRISKNKRKFRVMCSISQDESTGRILDCINDAESVFLLDVDSSKQDWLLEYCFLHNKYIYVLPTFQAILLNAASTVWLSHTPAFSLKNPRIDLSTRMLKRTIDILVSFLAIIITSPLMILVAIAVFIYDFKPVIFRQTRITRGGREFTLYKFRSMKPNAEIDGVARLTTKDDDRITPVGKVIRRTRLDELPQLFNVLSGKMSLVGPRPERPEIAEQYEKIFPNFAFRTKVKAGLTGYAQIFAQYNTSPDEKLLLDIMYIESFSILQDVKLMLQTIRVILTTTSTEGIDSGETTALKGSGEFDE